MTTATDTVTVRYWAAARAAAGAAEESYPPGTVGEILDAALAAHPALAPVLRVASSLLDGEGVGREAPAAPGSLLEVLPPFAGG